MRIPSGVTDQYIYFVAVDATDLKTRETGLSAFTVRRSRNGAASAAYTTPTVNETDSSNMPGVYELLLDEDMTIDSGDQSQEVCLHITCTGMAPVTRVFELYRPDVTAGETLTVGSGIASADVVEWLGSTPNALISGRVDTTVGAMQTGVLTATVFAAAAIDNAAIAADAIGSSELAATAASEIATAVRTELAAELALIDAAISSRLASASYTAPDNTTISAIAGYLDTEVAAILAAVDTEVAAIVSTLGAAGAGLTAVPWNATWDAEVQSEVADALAAYDPPTKAELDAAVAPLALEATLAATDLVVDATKVVADAIKAKTDNLPTDPADQSLIIAATDAIITAIDAVPTNAELATALAAADDAVLAAISTLSGAVATVDTVVDALAVSLAVVDGLVDAMTVRVSDMWQLQGLDGSNPAVFTPAAFDVGTIHINVTGDGTATTTLTRTT